MWLKDTGILERVKYDIFRPGIQIPDPRVRRNQPLILKQLGIIMIVLVVGLFMATIVFFVELPRRPKSNKATVEKALTRNISKHGTHPVKQQAFGLPIVDIN